MTPHPGWCRRTFTSSRPWENPDCAPFSEVPDVSRGELRLSAEVMLAEINGTIVPALPRQRAIHTLTILANQ